MKQISKRILAVSALAMAVAAPHVSAANWSDTFVGYRYGSNFDEPSKTDKIKKNILGFTHASGYDYGQNFFNVDLLQSNSKDPANDVGTSDNKGA